MNYRIKFSSRGQKDYETIKKSNLKNKARKILTILTINPYRPPIEKLKHNLEGAYSKSLNQQHRIVYEVCEKEKTVKILSMWTRYDNI